MKKMCKVAALLIMTIIISISSINAGAKTLYAPDGRQIDVPEEAVQSWCNVGWYEYPVVTIYSPNGQAAIISMDSLEAYKNVGWYDGRMAICICTGSGDVASIPLWQLQSYLQYGWYATDLVYNQYSVEPIDVDSFCNSISGYWISSPISTSNPYYTPIEILCVNGRNFDTALYASEWDRTKTVKKVLKNPDNSYDILLYFPEVPADEYMDSEYMPPAWGITNIKLPDSNLGSLTKTDYNYSEHPVINYLYHTESYTECLNICEQLWQ